MADHKNAPETPEFTSKTQQKNYARSMQELALQLLDGKPDWLADLPLNQKILDTIAKTRRIKSHIARKREVQYLAKLLLNNEPEQILATIAQQEAEEKARAARGDLLQRWVDAVLENPDNLTALYALGHPEALQNLRQLLRQCLKKQPVDKRQRRKLFDALRELDQLSPLPPPPA